MSVKVSTKVVLFLPVVHPINTYVNDDSYNMYGTVAYQKIGSNAATPTLDICPEPPVKTWI
jgi:hypothetical protein